MALSVCQRYSCLCMSEQQFEQWLQYTQSILVYMCKRCSRNLLPSVLLPGMRADCLTTPCTLQPQSREQLNSCRSWRCTAVDCVRVLGFVPVALLLLP